MTIEFKTIPILQELIDDLENQINNKTAELQQVEWEGAPRYICYGIEKELEVLESVLERVEAQQELIDLKTNSISLN